MRFAAGEAGEGVREADAMKIAQAIHGWESQQQQASP
jgi:hypothetical protein